MLGGTPYHWKYDENGTDHDKQTLEEEKHDALTLPNNSQLALQTEVTMIKEQKSLLR